MYRIVLTGPESSGKTTLARDLGNAFGVPWIPEFARTYLSDGPARYTVSDIVAIGEEQARMLEQKEQHSADPFVVLDTWMETLLIWAAYRFSDAPERLEELSNLYPADFYLLCTPDLPWEPDPLRENPHDRDVLYAAYEKWLTEKQVPYEVVSGSGQERLGAAQAAVKRWVRNNQNAGQRS